MGENKETLAVEEVAALEIISQKGILTINKEDPQLGIFVSLAGKGLIERVKVLDHPKSVAVTFKKK